jgi:hypothetical protein
MTKGLFVPDRKIGKRSERDINVCPGGKDLTTRGTLVSDGATLFYRASKPD